METISQITGWEEKDFVEGVPCIPVCLNKAVFESANKVAITKNLKQARGVDFVQKATFNRAQLPDKAQSLHL